MNVHPRTCLGSVSGISVRCFLEEVRQIPYAANFGREVSVTLVSNHGELVLADPVNQYVGRQSIHRRSSDGRPITQRLPARVAKIRIEQGWVRHCCLILGSKAWRPSATHRLYWLTIMDRSFVALVVVKWQLARCIQLSRRVPSR